MLLENIESQIKSGIHKRICGMKKIFKWLKRNQCKECEYYHSENNTCQSKKCVTTKAGYVNWFDRLFCESYKKIRY